MAQNVTPIKEEEASSSQLNVDAKSIKESKLKKIVISVLVIILALVLIILFYYFFLKTKNTDENSNQTNSSTPSGGAQVYGPTPIFSNTYSYQVNLSDGRRYLAVDLRLEVIDLDTITYIGRRLPIINDLIISTMQRETLENLRKADGVESLKQSLKRRLNSGRVFTEEFIKIKQTTAPIKDIFFDKFILQ